MKTPPAAAGPGADSELQEPAPGSEAAFGSPASHEAAEGEEESPGGEADPLCEMEARDIDWMNFTNGRSCLDSLGLHIIFTPKPVAKIF